MMHGVILKCKELVLKSAGVNSYDWSMKIL